MTWPVWLNGPGGALIWIALGWLIGMVLTLMAVERSRRS